jgi:predicted metal-binding transcription factor (methanogenesis marker protein 9)
MVTMSTTTRGRNQDRSLIAGEQEHEVAYAAKKAGVTPEKVRKAIAEVGNSRAAVEKQLKR